LHLSSFLPSFLHLSSFLHIFSFLQLPSFMFLACFLPSSSFLHLPSFLHQRRRHSSSSGGGDLATAAAATAMVIPQSPSLHDFNEQYLLERKSSGGVGVKPARGPSGGDDEGMYEVTACVTKDERGIGFSLLTSDTDGYIYIDQIHEGPAEEDGILKTGFRLVTINGNIAANMKFSQVQQMFNNLPLEASLHTTWMSPWSPLSQTAQDTATWSSDENDDGPVLSAARGRRAWTTTEGYSGGDESSMPVVDMTMGRHDADDKGSDGEVTAATARAPLSSPPSSPPPALPSSPPSPPPCGMEGRDDHNQVLPAASWLVGAGNGDGDMAAATAILAAAEVRAHQKSTRMSELEFTITFTDGPLGISVESDVTNTSVVVKRLEKVGQASLHPQMKVGLVIIAVNAQSVVGQTYDEVVKLLKTPRRPLDILFRRASYHYLQQHPSDPNPSSSAYSKQGVVPEWTPSKPSGVDLTTVDHPQPTSAPPPPRKMDGEAVTIYDTVCCMANVACSSRVAGDLQVFLTVLIFPTEIVLTISIFPTEIVFLLFWYFLLKSFLLF
jgi:hypothetical protein